jgi:hypothetical protein
VQEHVEQQPGHQQRGTGRRERHAGQPQPEAGGRGTVRQAVQCRHRCHLVVSLIIP